MAKPGTRPAKVRVIGLVTHRLKRPRPSGSGMAATLHGPGRAVEAGSLSAVATDGGDSPEAPLRRRPQLAVLVEGADRRGLLHDMTGAIQRHDGDIVSVEIVERGVRIAVYWELDAIGEADRHNIRGEKISIDTIPIVGEENLANAVRAVARLPRAVALVLAGSLMGGEVTDAVDELRGHGIMVVSLNMAGSVPDHADLVVTDPVQAGVMAVMAVASTASFDIHRVRGRRY